MKVILIAAIGRNRELGKNNELIWKISDDLHRFSVLTRDYTVIVGRKTLESIPGGLPRREIVAISSSPKVEKADYTFDSVEKAITYIKAKNVNSLAKDKLFIIGGAQVYAEALKYADELDLTLIDDECEEADVFFPEFEHLFYMRQSVNMTDKELNYKFSRWSKKN